MLRHQVVAFGSRPHLAMCMPGPCHLIAHPPILPPAGPLSYLICLIRALYELRSEVRATGVRGKVSRLGSSCATTRCLILHGALLELFLLRSIND